MSNYIFTEVDLVYLFILGFSVHMSYLAGKHFGISDAIDYFEAKGYIDLDDDWKIVLDKMVRFWYNSSIKSKYDLRGVRGLTQTKQNP